MAIKLFILGRPGSGKSSAARHIASCVKTQDGTWIHINDYNFLYERFRKDIGGCFKETDYGGFKVIDFTVLDEALEYVGQQAMDHYASELYDLVIVEFARTNYSDALQKFDREFLHDAYFLFIETDVETCIRRINERVAHPEYPDDNFISDDVIDEYYKDDSRSYIEIDLLTEYNLKHRQVRIIDNMGTIADFKVLLTEFIDYLIAIEKEARKLRETDPIEVPIVRPNPEIAK